MILFRAFKIREFERGFLFRDNDFVRVLAPGKHRFFDPLLKLRVDIVSVRDPWIRHADLDVIVRSGTLKNEAIVLDLKDDQRALVWIDGRFQAVLGRGLNALWTVFRNVRVE